ncbi:MAG TPA: PilT/PilU family type 4a pilus ATPase [Acidimicrobiales bacterium]|nr:PilT/PilU family type 4a pilus ATPase [Acidimicrobiales bacterium]
MSGAPATMTEEGARAEIDRLLQILCDLGGSDLHIKGGAPHSVRVDGQLYCLEGEPVINAEDTLTLAEAIMTPKIQGIFRERHEADFAYSVHHVGRFRINAFHQRGSVALAIRRVLTSSTSIADLWLPDVVRRLAEEQRGLVLVTGPTGSGKTTTLAAMINHINETRACHIVTVEDPIECLHGDKLSRIDQREVGFDTDSFSSAMRVVLRQDPDVILVGEMRDAETVFTALSAAETGHLVFSTLHTTTATETINRIIDFFPPHQANQIRLSLASALKGIIGQRLVPRADGNGRVPAIEVMVANGRIQQAIADPQSGIDIPLVISDGEYYGMQSFDQALAKLVINGALELQQAMNAASNPHDLKVMLERAGVVQTSGAYVGVFSHSTDDDEVSES